ncbi:glycosyltransferase 87 family protein [Actinomadura gamaensis]|uniref:Glycosyltransferase 87 family protein n=1 Tax=Actinomadura gamaensis TaxID=1763541 RepID=A0ABV9UAU8_9ACTN
MTEAEERSPGSRRNWIPTAWIVSVLTAAYAAVAVWQTASSVHRPLADRQADLHVYYGAVQTVARGAPLYSYTAPNGDPFTYPPFAVLVLWPIRWLSEPVLRVVWTGATCALIPMVAAIAFRRVTPPARGLVVGLGALLVLLAAPSQSNLRFGQVSLLVILLALIDAAEVTPPRWQGVLIGLAAGVKLTPLLFVPYLLLTGRRKAAATATIVFIACEATAALLLPSDSLAFWTREVFSTSRVGNLSATGNQSLNGMLLRLPLVASHREAAWILLSLAVTVTALQQARRLADHRLRTEAAAVIGCASLAVSPVSWTHHQQWTVLAGLLLFARRPPISYLLAGAILTLMVVTLPPLPGAFGHILASDVRGFCAIALCTTGLLATCRLAPLARLRNARPRIADLLAGRLIAAFSGLAVLASAVAIATGIVRLHFLPPDGLTAARWRAAMSDTSTPPAAAMSYLIAPTNGVAVKTAGRARADVARIELRVTSTGPLRPVPLTTGSSGTRTFAFVLSRQAGAALIAYDNQGQPISYKNLE